MELKMVKSGKGIILFFSFVMLCYQMHIAVDKLVNPSLVDSTKNLNFTEITPPLITFCPVDQWKYTDTGYVDMKTVMKGSYGGFFPENIGWGAQLNMTFDQMRKQLLKVDGQNIEIYYKKGTKYEKTAFEKRFYPKYGICFDVFNYPISKYIELLFLLSANAHGRKLESTVDVLITDLKQRTANTINIESNWGSSITIPSGAIHEYLVRVELVSFFDPRNRDACKSYGVGEYENCVTKELLKVWKPLINCNPPWMTSRDQCLGVINNTIGNIDEIQKKVSDTVDGIYEMGTYPAKERCTKPCNITQSDIVLRKIIKSKGKCKTNILKLKFANIVVYKTKILDYGTSKFFIDFGSSLGLWFGLSLIGLTDLAAISFQWTRRIWQNTIQNFMK